MKLSTYIREDHDFQIFIIDNGGQWEIYDPSIHGDANSICRDYLVAYANGEVLENTADAHNLPPSISYITRVPYKPIKMPECVTNDPRVKIVHEPSAYHQYDRYCTKLSNASEIPLRVNRFSAFSKGFFGGYRLSTISNDWFSHDQFMCWYNSQTPWLQPGSTVADYDNFGFGNGYWIFEIEFEDKEKILVKSRLPKKELKAAR